MSIEPQILNNRVQSSKALYSRVLLGTLIISYSIMWIGGIGSYVLFAEPPAEAAWAAPVFLFLAGLIVIATTDRSELVALLLISLLGLTAEIIGVRYRFIFGEYSYTETLRPQLLGVPLVMASAWMVLGAYVIEMLHKLPGRLEAAAAAIWMTAIDLVIDPLASGKLNYWRWSETGPYYGVPVRNFLGWFAVSFLIFSLVGRKKLSNPWARYVGLSIILFFSLIALFHHLLFAGSVGIMLCLVHFVFNHKDTKKIK